MARTGDLAGAKAEVAEMQKLRATLEKTNNSYWADRTEEQMLAVLAWVALAEGGEMRVGYAAQNGHGYVPVGRILAERGETYRPYIIFTGAIITETIFTWPGMGRLFFEGISKNDWPLVQAITMMSAFLVVAGNLLADLCYAAVDPRIRYE